MPSVYSPGISGREDVPSVEDIVKAEYDSELTRDKKRQFAVALAKDPSEPWDAARAVWPHDTGYAIYVKQHWPHDPEIMAYIQAVHDVAGVAGQLPTQDEYALHLWKLAKQALDDDVRLKYLRLYAETTGALKRPSGDAGVVINQNRVMIVERLGSDEEWEKTTSGQQQALQEELTAIAEAVDVTDSAD